MAAATSSVPLPRYQLTHRRRRKERSTRQLSMIASAALRVTGRRAVPLLPELFLFLSLHLYHHLLGLPVLHDRLVVSSVTDFPLAPPFSTSRIMNIQNMSTFSAHARATIGVQNVMTENDEQKRRRRVSCVWREISWPEAGCPSQSGPLTHSAGGSAETSSWCG
jgi:hypothetical protein